MKMSPPNRKLLLTAHVLASVGWVGALGVFLAHAIASVTSQEPFVVRAAALAMAVTAWFVILPLSLASLITGILQALGTAWGLLRHYWVAFKLVLTSVATLVLLLKLGPISQLADAAAVRTFSSGDLIGLKTSLLVHALGGLVVLVSAVVLAVFKPAGMISRGEARQGGEAGVPTMPRWAKIFGAILVALVVLVVLMMLGGNHGPSAHMSL